MRAIDNSRRRKVDDFYTQYSDIEAEIRNYADELNGKWVYSNCDGPQSNFVKYFTDNFDRFHLKHFTATGFDEVGQGWRMDYDGKNLTTTPITTGDFRSAEALDILKQADIIITNPPFSLKKPFLYYLIEYNKKFIIISTSLLLSSGAASNAVKWINAGKLYLGSNEGFSMKFIYVGTKCEKLKTGDLVPISNTCWYQNIKIFPPKQLELTKKYDPTEYQKYDNYDAIEVSRIKNIPIDYEGEMGVPITFLSYFDKTKFELKKISNTCSKNLVLFLNGKQPFVRMIIKRKSEVEK